MRLLLFNMQWCTNSQIQSNRSFNEVRELERLLVESSLALKVLSFLLPVCRHRHCITRSLGINYRQCYICMFIHSGLIESKEGY